MRIILLSIYKDGSAVTSVVITANIAVNRTNHLINHWSYHYTHSYEIPLITTTVATREYITCHHDINPILPLNYKHTYVQMKVVTDLCVAAYNDAKTTATTANIDRG